MIQNESLYMPIVNKDVSMVDCVYNENGQHYTFKCDLHNIAVGDVVVCQSGGKMAVTTVVAINVQIPANEHIEYKWVVQHVDMSLHQLRLDAEKLLITKINTKRIDHQRAQMLDALGLTQADVNPMIGHTDEAE